MMDDLDKELFSSSLKKISTSSSLAKVPKSVIDFDEEDPLGDLISSGETTPVKSSSKKASTKETPVFFRQQSKSKLKADLFGLKNPKEVTNTASIIPATNAKPVNKVENPGDWLGLQGETPGDQEDNSDLLNEKFAASTPKRLYPLSKESSKEDDFLSTLNTRNSTQTISVSKDFTITSDEFSSKANLPTQKRSSGGVTQETKKTSSILNSFISDFDSKNITPTETSVMKGFGNDRIDQGNKNSYTLSGSREPRRNTRRRGGDIVDPLGLFASSTKSSQEDAKETQDVKEVEPSPAPAARAPHVFNADQIPTWLGGTTNLPASSSSVPNNQIITISNDVSTSTAEVTLPAQPDTDMLTGLSNLEAQAGEAATQQQKSLITALALKRQEDSLLKLQAQQATLLAQHEQQLGALVQRQAQRQQQMMCQQEQIQAHIQALMVQPPAFAPISLPSMLWNTDENSRFNSDSQLLIEGSRSQTEKELETILDLKGQVKRLEIENQETKAQLELEKQRHDNHLKDMENLFRRQLIVQEELMARQEKHYLSEIEAHKNEASSRISRLKDEHSQESAQQTQRMAQLHGEWLADLQRLGEFHQQAVEMLRSEQTSAIEHWKNLQVVEIAAIKEASSNARLLEAAVSHLQESTSSLLELKDQIKKEALYQNSEKKELFLKQEVQLNSLREVLEKQAAALDAERTSLSTMSRDLESRLLRQQQEVVEDKNRFEVREKAWEREKLGAIEMLNKEKKHLENLQLEAQAELNELGERKLALATDVARLETTLRIQSSNANRNSQQAEQMVVEARATLEAAQEAGKEVQNEREEIISLKQSLSAEQERLTSFEREIQIREQQLEEQIARAKAYREEGISALEEARRLERERTEHATDLAQRLLHLKQREDRLAEEKLAISMEWKKIQELRDITGSQSSQLTVPTLSTLNTQIFVDPLPIIMKLEAEQGLDFVTLDHVKYHSSLLESISQ